MQKRRTRLIILACMLVSGAALLWYWDTHIPKSSLSRFSVADSDDCLLVRLAIQASYPDFLISHDIAKTYHAPMLKCTAARTGVELRPYMLKYDHRYHGLELFVRGPIYSASHMFAFVALGRGDSIRGTSAFCRLQRWPWGWGILSCRRGSYLT